MGCLPPCWSSACISTGAIAPRCNERVYVLVPSLLPLANACKATGRLRRPFRRRDRRRHRRPRHARDLAASDAMPRLTSRRGDRDAEPSTLAIRFCPSCTVTGHGFTTQLIPPTNSPDPPNAAQRRADAQYPRDPRPRFTRPPICWMQRSAGAEREARAGLARNLWRDPAAATWQRLRMSGDCPQQGPSGRGACDRSPGHARSRMGRCARCSTTEAVRT